MATGRPARSRYPPLARWVRGGSRGTELGTVKRGRPGPAADPPRSRAADWWRLQVRRGCDHYVRVDTCGYSVDPAVLGHPVPPSGGTTKR
ncbi:Mu transposase domain-containing protein [Streptomyces sp. NPDC090741]|uniref:Mu transposase domain-containing protein n=1 Tax=Streptomyces sp. NPDC090741 TaxID=3365967 RepID=UPI0038248E9A